MSKLTIQSISDRTGYSVSTVSRVLSGKGEESRISKKAIEQITAEAQRLHFKPNLLAQGLRTRKTYTVGLTVPGISNPFFATLSSRVIRNLKEKGYHTLLSDSMESENDFEESLRMFQSRNVDGIIAIPVGSDPSLLEDIASSIPTVQVDRYYEGSSLPFFSTDNFRGGYIAVENLISRGYRNMLVIQGAQNSSPNRDRLKGVVAAIADRPDIKVKYDVVGDAFTSGNGYKQVLAAFSGKYGYDCIFCFASSILLGAVKALDTLGIKLSDKIGIASFGNNVYLDYLSPHVTFIEHPLDEMVSRAVDTLISMMSKEGEPSTDVTDHVLLPPSIADQNM